MQVSETKAYIQRHIDRYHRVLYFHRADYDQNHWCSSCSNLKIGLEWWLDRMDQVNA